LDVILADFLDEGTSSGKDVVGSFELFEDSVRVLSGDDAAGTVLGRREARKDEGESAKRKEKTRRVERKGRVLTFE